jgi:hypothetical protein
MKRSLIGILAILLAVSFSLVGCGPKKVNTSQEAIKIAQGMETPEKKINYLMAQANAFFKEKDFQEAINISQYILWNLDSNSEAAKKMMRTAQDAMAVEVQMKAEALKKQIK